MLEMIWSHHMTYMLLLGMKISETTLKNSFALPPQVAHLCSIWLSNSTPNYIPKINSCRYTTGNMYKNVHCSTPHNIKSPETT